MLNYTRKSSCQSIPDFFTLYHCMLLSTRDSAAVMLCLHTQSTSQFAARVAARVQRGVERDLAARAAAALPTPEEPRLRL